MAMNEETIAMYPYISYKNATFIPTIPLLENTGGRFELIKEFDTREDDILFCSAMKSGTHWVHEILSMLVAQKAEYNLQGPFWELNLEVLTSQEDVDKIKGPRIFSTHIPFSFLPKKHIEKGYKIVYLNRNQKDIAVSLYNFTQGKIGMPKWTWNEYFDMFVGSEDTMYTGWFNYTREMSAAVKKKSANIIPVMYEDLIMDTKHQVKKLADFLGVNYTNDLIDDIVTKCNFDNLKNNKFDVSVMVTPEKKSTLFRKGKIGDWKNYFTVAQSEQLDLQYKQEMKDVDVNFIYDAPKSDKCLCL